MSYGRTDLTGNSSENTLRPPTHMPHKHIEDSQIMSMHIDIDGMNRLKSIYLSDNPALPAGPGWRRGVVT